MHPIDHTITQSIEARLEASGKTRYAVCKATGIPTTTFDRKMIRGSFTAAEIANIAEVLDSRFTELIGVAA